MKEYPLKEISLFAGAQADGKPVYETITAAERESNVFQLLKSPAFMRGIASGDVIKVDAENKAFTLVKRSGNLCLRVIAKNNISAIAGDLIAALEKLGGTLDFQNERMLIFSIHVSCGFTAIEELLNRHVGANTESAWLYGNVYEHKDGELVPINWWQEFLKPE
ncbi:DUF4265 domain-containing protein [Teredinibacter haidensis]|uniref:DUF4265 domain-containing protein n=1 Tax=Teredinibacter haidensis TaxID=2731755 RepID=UPI000948BE07|nr:DUF4265 domain-containing protein [Teredinibacter haidensis]